MVQDKETYKLYNSCDPKIKYIYRRFAYKVSWIFLKQKNKLRTLPQNHLSNVQWSKSQYMSRGRYSEKFAHAIDTSANESIHFNHLYT